MPKDKILIIGVNSQIGIELIKVLRQNFGHDNVIGADIHLPTDGNNYLPFEIINVTESAKLFYIVEKYRVTQIYHLAGLKSSKSELNPLETWSVNMDGLFNVLEVARHYKIKKVFFPSTISVFGSNTPRINTPQDTIRTPETVYGMSKVAGENWCSYYFRRYGIDVRGIRFPGIINSKGVLNGNTMDFVTEMFNKATKNLSFECYLKANTRLPMIYIDDAVQSILKLMEAPTPKISIRSSYNIAGISCSPEEIYDEIKKHIPDFVITYKPDFRQTVAESLPESINDSIAKKDWGWTPQYDLPKIVSEMLTPYMAAAKKNNKEAVAR